MTPPRDQRILSPSRTLAHALWECMLLGNADVSDYTDETRTPEGREAGFEQWCRMRTSSQMARDAIEAVQDLRDCYDVTLEHDDA